MKAHELFRNGERIQIQEKPFQLLELLIRAEGSLVSRERIFEALWPDVHVERNRCLNTAMRKLRTTLGDDAHAPRLIETRGSLGYRLMASMKQPSGDIPGPSEHQPRLAILPFRELVPGAEDGFCEGLTEQLIARIGSEFRHITVLAPTSVLHYRNDTGDPVMIGRALHADFLLCGSVSRQAPLIRITARLLRGPDQACVWAESYDREMVDIFPLQDELIRQIAFAILRTLPAPGQADPHLTTAPSTYEKYLKGLHFFSAATEPGFSRAIELFQEVIQEDDGFAPAFASLALLCSYSGQYGPLAPDQTFPRVESLVSRALLLSPDLPETHVALGMARMFHRADFPGAEEAFRRAMVLNPSSTRACLGHSQICTVLGRHGEAVATLERAIDLDPLAPELGIMRASALFFAGRLLEALEQIQHTLELHPSFPTALATAGWILSALGRHDAALCAHRSANHGNSDSPVLMIQHAHALAAAGQAEEARALLRKVLAMRRTAWVSPYSIALVHIALGENGAAFRWLVRAIKERDGWRVLSGVDPRLEPLAFHPGFAGLLEGAGLRYPERLKPAHPLGLHRKPGDRFGT